MTVTGNASIYDMIGGEGALTAAHVELEDRPRVTAGDHDRHHRHRETGHRKASTK
jgi:hypothetical protein